MLKDVKTEDLCFVYKNSEDPKTYTNTYTLKIGDYGKLKFVGTFTNLEKREENSFRLVVGHAFLDIYKINPVFKTKIKFKNSFPFLYTERLETPLETKISIAHISTDYIGKDYKKETGSSLIIGNFPILGVDYKYHLCGQSIAKKTSKLIKKSLGIKNSLGFGLPLDEVFSPLEEIIKKEYNL
ncbi:MAG: hypothetical protein ISS82_04130 [Nanoarchaeota archaeon]|nr:hypothetical protein [Nanoarchaeota archaeon]